MPRRKWGQHFLRDKATARSKCSTAVAGSCDITIASDGTFPGEDGTVFRRERATLP